MNERVPPDKAPDSGRLDDLIESVADAFYAVDREWRLVVMNQAAEAFFNLRREEVLGVSLWEIFPEGRERPFGQACLRAMEHGEVIQMESPSAMRPGRTVDLRIGPLRAGGVAIALRDVTDRKEAELKAKAAEDHLNLLVLELNHRVKNNLATIQAIAVQTLRGTGRVEDAREAFLDRIEALAAAHDILTRERWEGVNLAEIARSVLHALDGAGDRVKLEGPDLRLSARAALSLSMAFHELGTNALKYGALSAPKGEVRLTWRRRDPAMLEVDWEERGGPPVEAPRTRGFGSRLLEKGLAAELRGQVTMSFAPGGVRCAIRAPLDPAGA